MLGQYRLKIKCKKVETYQVSYHTI